MSIYELISTHTKSNFIHRRVAGDIINQRHTEFSKKIQLLDVFKKAKPCHLFYTK